MSKTALVAALDKKLDQANGSWALRWEPEEETWVLLFAHDGGTWFEIGVSKDGPLLKMFRKMVHHNHEGS